MTRPFKEKLTRLDVGWMVRETPPALPWIIEGLAVKGMLTVLNGREGEKKSLLSMALAAGVAKGQIEAGFTCHRGHVVIVDAENGEAEIHRRVHTLGLPEEGISVYGVEAGAFDLRKDLYDIERVIDVESPDLLILDSYRSLWSGRENDSDEVSESLDPLRGLAHRTNTAIKLLHHSGKGGDYRGSSAIGASAELGFKLARSADDPDPSRCYLQSWKCRPSEKPARRWLRLDIVDGRLFFEEADAFEGVPAERKAPVRDGLKPYVLGALGDKPQKRAEIAQKVGRDPKDRSVGRILEEAAHEGLAELTDSGWVAGGRVASSLGVLPPATLNGSGDEAAGLAAVQQVVDAGDGEWVE